MKTKRSPSKTFSTLDWIMGFVWGIPHLPGPKPAPPAPSPIKFEPHMLASFLNPLAGSSIHPKILNVPSQPYHRIQSVDRDRHDYRKP